MKLQLAITYLSLRYVPAALGQTCAGVSGTFTLHDITGPCNYETLLEEYTRQVFDTAGSTCSAGSTLTAKEDFDGKLVADLGGATGEEAAALLCKALYDNADVTAFTEAANKGDDLHFEQMFYNGRGEWQEEVETEYESPDGEATSRLREDAAQVREFYLGDGSYSRVAWPDSLTNFEASTCTSNAAMCCWPKDRQANDGNGNCATEYDINCVDKDPADNTNLCFADLDKGNGSTGFGSGSGFMAFPDDNNNGEGAIHCHGFAWADDEYHPTARYKANNLFFVSMYDHMHQRGYVKNIPGMPMCGCMDQMPIATRSDCTQVDLTEDWEVIYDGSSFTPKMVKVEVDFNACQGANHQNNNLYFYVKRLYEEGLMTAAQFGKVGRVLTNDHDCYHATEFQKQLKGYKTAYSHDEDTWTLVAGRDELAIDHEEGKVWGREAFNKAFFEQSLTAPNPANAYDAANPFPANENPIMMRVCPNCRDTHRRIFYRRLTPIADSSYDLLHDSLHRTSSSANVNNVWNVDFTLHSTYEDAKTGANPWQCQGDNFKYHYTFYGKCSPDGTSVGGQYTRFHDFPGPQPNVAFYVNKPQRAGVQDYADNDAHTRASGLTDVDIGNPYKPGNTWEDDGVIHVVGGGNDIWQYRDEFHFKSQPWSGDIDVSVHLSSFANNGNDRHAKAGIMLRSDNSEDATYAFNMLTAREGIHNQHRRSKGKHSGDSGSRFKEGMDGKDHQTSAWLRIVKKQERIEFYRGDNVDPSSPGEWILQNDDTILFPDDSYRVGLAVTSHRWDYSSEATFEDYSVDQYLFPTSSPSVSSAPTPWAPLKDIGYPQRDGAFWQSQDGEVDHLKGSGTGLWGSSDMFAFYGTQEAMPAEGISVTAYIKRFDNGNLHGRGGLMVRDTYDPDSANAFVGAAGYDQGAVFQSRCDAGGNTMHHKMIYANWDNHMWVKLDVTPAGVVTASYKIEDGDEWVQLGTTALTLTDSSRLQVGRAVTAGSDHYYAELEMQSQHYSIGSLA